MPLKKGKTRKVMGDNYKAEIKAGKSPAQARAIMLATAYPNKQKKKKTGSASRKKKR